MNKESDIIKFRKITMVNGFIYHVVNDMNSFKEEYNSLNNTKVYTNHKFNIDGKCIIDRKINRHINSTYAIDTSSVLIRYNKIVSVEEIEIILKTKN